MKKYAVMGFITPLAIAGAFISSYIYEVNLPGAYTTVMSDVKFAEQVSASGEVVEFEDTMKVNAVINEKYASKVKIGQRVVIKGKGFDESYGKIEYISDSARRLSNGMSDEAVVDVVIGFDEDSDLSDIKSGYTASVKINISDEKNIKVVPYEAVHKDSEGVEFVYIFDSGMAVKRNIITGSETRDGVEVISGICSDDVILMSDDDSLSDGYYVKIEG